MLILDTPHKRKSAAITAVILMIIIFGIFNYGMRYLDPPEEYGLAINFGSSDVGSGEPVEDTQKIAFPNVDEVQEVVEEEVVEEEVEEVLEKAVKEEILTEESEKEVPVVEKVEEVKKEAVKEIAEKKKEIKKPVEKVVEKAVAKPKPKPSKATQDALNNLLKGNTSDGKPQGEGDDAEPGVKGKEGGDASSSKYYGNTGSGSGGDYNLAGRKALTTPKQQPNCEEEGIVVVEIQVDKAGKVIYARPGAQGTNNSANCLFKAAKEAALKTKWNSDNKAPVNQIGTIIYRFTLSK